MDWSLSDLSPLNQKSAWLVSHISSTDHRVLTQNFSTDSKRYKEVKIDGVLRDLLRGFKIIPIDSFDHGLILDIAFTFMSEGHRDLAVKYNSMKIIERLIKVYPELKSEFVESLEIQIELDSTTFSGHARKTLGRIG